MLAPTRISAEPVLDLHRLYARDSYTVKRMVDVITLQSSRVVILEDKVRT